MSVSEASRVLQCMLRLETLEHLREKIEAMREEEEVAALQMALYTTTAKAKAAPKGSVAKERARQKREFRILSLTLERLEERAQELFGELTALIQEDAFLEQFMTGLEVPPMLQPRRPRLQ